MVDSRRHPMDDAMCQLAREVVGQYKGLH
jgi:hypothetical protein